jgi:hypothetical protein
MSAALNNNSTRSRVPGTVAISDDELRRFAPSVFASNQFEGVSERYSFLPTSSILNGMREIFKIQLSVGGDFAGQVEPTRANPYLSRIGRLVGSASTLK